jgi:hypothetical protein
MRTVLLRREAAAARGGHGDPEPDAVVESLSKLPELLLDVAVVTIVGREN